MVETKAFSFSVRERELLLKTVEWIADLLPEIIEDPGFTNEEHVLHVEMLAFCKTLAERLKEEVLAQ